MIACFEGNFNAFLKSFDAKSLDKMYSSVLVKIQAKWEFKITEAWLILLCSLLKLIFTTFVKRFSKTLYIESSLFCDFSDWKHVRTIATCKKKTFSSRQFLQTMFCYFQKIRSQSNDFHHQFHTFAIKIKGI